jgi:hypothetical protein
MNLYYNYLASRRDFGWHNIFNVETRDAFPQCGGLRLTQGEILHMVYLFDPSDVNIVVDDSIPTESVVSGHGCEIVNCADVDEYYVVLPYLDYYNDHAVYEWVDVPAGDYDRFKFSDYVSRLKRRRLRPSVHCEIKNETVRRDLLSGKAQLVITFEHEPMIDTDFEQLAAKLSDYGIKKDTILILSDKFLVKELQFRNISNLIIKYVNVYRYQPYVYQSSYPNFTSVTIKNRMATHQQRDEKLYICPMRRTRPCRHLWLYYLKHSNLIDDVSYSWMPSVHLFDMMKNEVHGEVSVCSHADFHHEYPDDVLREPLRNWVEQISSSFIPQRLSVDEMITQSDFWYSVLRPDTTFLDNNKLPKLGNFDHDVGLTAVWAPLYLVSESFFQWAIAMRKSPYGSQFITEKSYIPFDICSMPIYISTPFTVETIRDEGFDVFDDLIDHSYDAIVDDRERMEAIITELMRLRDNKQQVIQFVHDNADRILANFNTRKNSMNRKLRL